MCWIGLGQVGLGWDGLGCNIALRWGTGNSSTIVNTSTTPIILVLTTSITKVGLDEGV